MSLRLKRSVDTLLVATLFVALAVAALVVPAGMAEAQGTVQGTAPTKDPETRSVVVEPGDSLWSISRQRLGPNATAQQIAQDVERIYALNQDRIGADPGLIFAGQELLMPEVVEPSRAEQPSTGATRARSGNEPAEAGTTRDRVVQNRTNRASREAVREAAGKAGKALEPVTQQAKLPDAAATAPVPAVRSLATDGSPREPVTSFARTVRSALASAASTVAESFAGVRAEGGRLLGWGTLLLTGAVITALCASTPRIATRRKARMREIRFRETYGRPYAAFDPFASREEGAWRSASEVRNPTASSGGSMDEGAASKDRFAYVGLLAIARAKLGRVRRQRSLGPGRLSYRYPGPDVQGSGLRSDSRRSHPTRPQKRSLRRRRRTTATAAVNAAKGAHARRHDEWEPGVALKNSLEELPLRSPRDQSEAMARLKPGLEEAVRTLTLLERQRGLSDRERHRREAIRMLLMVAEEVE